MSEHVYEQGRLNLPFVGHCTFAKQSVCLDWENIEADVAVLGAPFDMGAQYRAGARFGPARSARPRPSFPSVMAVLTIMKTMSFTCPPIA